MATHGSVPEPAGNPGRISAFHRDGLTFPVVDSGPIEGESVLLLHGWPQDSRSWSEVSDLLNQAGFRTFSPDLRGASATAAPRWRWQYRLDELAADVLAMIDRIGQPVHVVGHDWGAAAAWATAIVAGDRLLSLSALSVPHPGAFARAMLTTRQGLASWYMYLFQLPLMPEIVLRTKLFGQLLRKTGQSDSVSRRDAERVRDRVIARGGLHWYRGMPFSDPRIVRGRVAVPVLQVWSDGDTAILESGIELTARYADGPFRLEVLPGVSHWIPEEAPEAVSRLLIEHFRANGRGEEPLPHELSTRSSAPTRRT
ncbi:alpha/beta fold hydrolase [Nocardia sp. ET3-3]|uniref:Alpha/beta fold hydrolase n=1 Tax=Nocardia terrae TaxID=2675851 RepID=A0A7K1URG4_9NOCA|nr:alpha/beta fold hydrolase [Nocardia terrae]MVU76934.1 alpha/beta fold hydrolase [Nocardia terrae]